MNYLVLLPILIPILGGLLLMLLPKNVYGAKEGAKRPYFKMHIIFSILMLLSAGSSAYVLLSEVASKPVVLFELLDNIPVMFCVDEVGTVFAWVATIAFVCAGAFSFRYMKGEKNYYGFFLMTYGVLQGLDFAGNLVTMYLFFEMVTLLSFPLVMQTKTKESIMAALKYIFYSLAGAYMGLFAIYFLYQNTTTLTFTPGGTLDMAKVSGHPALILAAVMVAIIGFGVKAGMFPMHAWLPTAHPVAPAPASGVLSGVIVKAGVLALIRVIYYIVGPDFLRGTWVQTTWMILALITVFMGSLLAYREKVLKKRLAYSTVSQISYILLGLAVLEPQALTGSLLHVVFHALIKTALFLCAGAFIHETGKERVDELTGIGKKMPVTTWGFTIASLGLIGIPPTGGFVSKWYLATGALAAEVGAFRYIIPAILLASALLTAGYLLPIPIKGFFPGTDYDYENNPRKEASVWMWLPIIILVILSFVGGIFSEVVTDYLLWIPAKVF